MRVCVLYCRNNVFLTISASLSSSNIYVKAAIPLRLPKFLFEVVLYFILEHLQVTKSDGVLFLMRCAFIVGIFYGVDNI